MLLPTDVTSRQGGPDRCLGTAAFRAQNIIAISEKATSNQGGVTFVAIEAITMPVLFLKGNKLGASQSCDGLGAFDALLGKQLSKAVSTVWLLITGSKLLPSQYLLAVVAGEAFPMPGRSFVGDATLVDNSIAFHASLCKMLLIAWHTNDFLVTGDKALVANRLLALFAEKALFMPLLATVFILLHSSSEDVATTITSCCKIVVMAVSTVQLLILGSKWLIHQ